VNCFAAAATFALLLLDYQYAGSYVRQNAEQWIASPLSDERAAVYDFESRRSHNGLDLVLKPFLYIGIALDSRNRGFYPSGFRPTMQGGKKKPFRSQYKPETRE
jgi:hypothetical protein